MLKIVKVTKKRNISFAEKIYRSILTKIAKQLTRFFAFHVYYPYLEKVKSRNILF